MNFPPLPANEEARLKALEEYAILDTLPENDFDEITHLTSEICETPISLITLLDKTRQWSKSHYGLSSSVIPRPYSFCAYAINQPDQMLIVSDSRLDDRFQDNPLVTGDPYVIFYAGVALVTPNGFPLGTLCVIDSKPRTLTPLQTLAIQTLANQVMKLLEFRKRNLELIDLQKKVNLQNEELKQFNYFASHDLREPLRMITSFLGLLKIDLKDSLSASTRQYIDFAMDGAQRMNKLILDLLMYSTIGKEKLERELVHLEKVILDVKQNLHQQITENNASIVLTGPFPSLHASASEMISLFQNLISNAIKFRRKDVNPTVTVSCLDETPFWKFQVRDNGIGIAPQHQEMIFEKFKKVHASSEYAGSGLGLAICKRIVENYGGGISIDSSIHTGTTIYFTLPQS